MQDCLGIILARTGSKRIKNKNFIKIKDKFIFEFPLIEALKTKKFTKIIISSDIKKKLFFNNLFKKKIYRNRLIYHQRDSKMLHNNYHMIPIVNHIINLPSIKNLNFKYIFMIFSTGILLKKKDFIEMIKIIKKNEIENKGCMVQTICKYPAPIEWAFQLDKNNILKKKFKYKIKNSDEYNDYYYDTGGLNLFNKSYFKKNIKKVNFGYNIGKVRGVDVDDLQDLQIAKSIFLNNSN